MYTVENPVSVGGRKRTEKEEEGKEERKGGRRNLVSNWTLTSCQPHRVTSERKSERVGKEEWKNETERGRNRKKLINN